MGKNSKKIRQERQMREVARCIRHISEVSAQNKLVEIGEPAVPILIGLLEGNLKPVVGFDLWHVSQESLNIQDSTADAIISVLGRIGDGRAAVPIARQIDRMYVNDMLNTGQFDGHCIPAALQKIGARDASVQEVLLDFIRGIGKWPYHKKAMVAADCLGALRCRAAVPELIEILMQEKQLETGKEIITALGNIGDPRAITIIRLFLENHTKEERASPSSNLPFLIKHGFAPGIHSLVTESGEVTDHLREPAIEALGKLGDEASVDLIGSMALNEKNGENLRCCATRALGNIATNASCRMLIDLLGDVERSVSFAAEFALDSVGYTAPEALRDGLYSQYSGVQKKCVRLLIKADESGAVPVLIARIYGRMTPELHAEIMSQLAQFGSNAPSATVPLLISEMKKHDELHHRFFAETLGKIGGKEALDALIGELAESHWYCRQNAADALGETKNPAAVSHLIARLGDDLNVSKSAAAALGKIGGKEAEAALIATVENQSVSFVLKNEAIDALRELGCTDAIPAIAGELNSGMTFESAKKALISLNAGQIVLDFYFNLLQTSEPVHRFEILKEIRWVQRVMDERAANGATPAKLPEIRFDPGDFNLRTSLASTMMRPSNALPIGSRAPKMPAKIQQGIPSFA